MSTLPNKQAHAAKPTMPTFGGFSANKASMLLEKTNPGLRRSTPDSEALASSDDETDHHRSTQAGSMSGTQRSMRRTSWLNEIPSSTRKPSMTANTPYSPTTSHPVTPSGDPSAWGTSGSPGLGNPGNWSAGGGSSYPWGGIWTSDGRKEAPSRLQEVLPSPTAVNSPVARFLADDTANLTGGRGTMGDSSIPFSIPLHPTPKTYRSQSYSVGQLDPESFNITSTAMPGPPTVTRGRGGGPYPGLVRRPSRPSGIGDRGHDSGGLGRVREVDDDEESKDEHEFSQKEQQARKIEQLTKENALLRQAATKQHEYRYRDRTMSSTSASAGAAMIPSPIERARMRGSLVDDSDLAVDELDEAQNGQTLSAIENRNIENVKRAHWQTSLGFETVLEPPQSRRHSFADVPTRHGSISSTGETFTADTPYDSQDSRREHEDAYGTYGETAQGTVRGEYPQYFSGAEAVRRAEESHRSLAQAYPAPNTYGREGGYASSTGQNMPPLYIVGFKCRRSDVFYIQEGTGLHVEPGDLVIVEADRGTDLGTVLHANISWEEARQKKEEYAEEHYKWLMMFSRQSQSGGPNAVNPNGLSGLNGAPGSAVGGMGPPGHHAPQEPTSGELKPKLIKRLAQSHEIQTLKDKEGNEAKAKRMCQQKVVEHRLNMEILDAEFQMDWKKLTFYYFADTYINFNSLVTDLFKIYKTRIWMSAINPASFVTPTSSLSIAHSFGLQGQGTNPEHSSNRRRQPGPHMTQPSPTTYEELASPHSYAASQGNGLRNAYFNPYQTLGTGVHQNGPAMSAYQPMMPQSAEPFSPYLPSPYQMLNPAASSFATSHSPSARTGRQNQSPTTDWTGNFQGLSLGSGL